MDKSKHEEEMVAWVDENENLIKVIPRTLANSDPKYLHREVAALVYDSKGRVLLQQRAKTKRVKPSVWTVTVAVHVTFGDSLDDTIDRETREEVGLTISKWAYLFREDVREWTEHHFCHWYLGKYTKGKVIVEPTEVDAYEWIGEDEYQEFKNNNDVDGRTDMMLKRFWSGEWDDLLQ